MPITDKVDMYRRLSLGEFGNSVPAFMGLAAWKNRGPQWNSPLWGVRSMSSGDKRAKLDIPTEEVEQFCLNTFGMGGYNISPMVDQWLTYRAEIFDGVGGLVCRQIHGHREVKWRKAFQEYGHEVRGAVALSTLRTVLNQDSFDDLMMVFERYPYHVVELTAMERCFGLIQNRNAVIWEVRDGISGQYEHNSGWAI